MKKMTRFILVLSITLLFMSCFPGSCKYYSELILTLPNTSIETVFFDNARLDIKDSSGTYVFNKAEYDNSIYDLCVDIINQDFPVRSDYNGILKLEFFDNENNLLEAHKIDTWGPMLASD